MGLSNAYCATIYIYIYSYLFTMFEYTDIIHHNKIALNNSLNLWYFVLIELRYSLGYVFVVGIRQTHSGQSDNREPLEATKLYLLCDHLSVLKSDLHQVISVDACKGLWVSAIFSHRTASKALLGYGLIAEEK